MLLNNTDSLVITLAAPHTTTAPQWHASAAGVRTFGSTDGTTAVDMIPSPYPIKPRTVDWISVRNQDTVSHTVTIGIKYDDTASAVIAATLGAGDHLEYTPAHGWRRITSAGVFVVSTAAGGGGGGAPVDGQYVVIANDATMTGERALAVGTGLSITDGGADASVTVSLDGDLEAIAGVTGTGVATRTAANTWALRTMSSSGAGLSWTNADGAAGNPTLALANDVAAVEALAGTGLAARTAAATWATRTITTSNILLVDITDGDGVAGDPTIDLVTGEVVFDGLSAVAGSGLSLTSPAGAGLPSTITTTGNLAALDDLASTGIAVRTGASTWTTRSIAVSGSGLSIANAGGVAADPTITLATATALGQISSTQGTILYRDASTWTVLAPGTAGEVLQTGGAAANPSWTTRPARWDEQYVVLAASGNLSNESVLAVGADGLQLTGSTISIKDDLLALEGMAATGLAARTGASTWTTRSVATSGAGLSITNGSGVSGNPTLALADDVAAIEALATAGVAVRTGASTWTTRSVAVSGTGLSITNADGVSGNPTVTVTPSTMLDSFSSTRGAVLYRGAAGWSALVPSTVGHVLTDGGVGADPSWAAPPGGGSGLTHPQVMSRAIVVGR
jgi:hypothetical protein